MVAVLNGSGRRQIPKARVFEGLTDSEFEAGLRLSSLSDEEVADARKQREDRFRVWLADKPAPDATAEPGAVPQLGLVEAYSTEEDEFMPTGPLTVVGCDVPGWTSVKVSFDLRARWDALFGDIPQVEVEQADPEFPDDPEKKKKVLVDDPWIWEKRCMELCPRIEWHKTNRLTGQPYPDSVAPDFEGYKMLGRRALDVEVWILGPGLKKAQEQATRPLSVG